MDPVLKRSRTYTLQCLIYIILFILAIWVALAVILNLQAVVGYQEHTLFQYVFTSSIFSFAALIAFVIMIAQESPTLRFTSKGIELSARHREYKPLRRRTMVNAKMNKIQQFRIKKFPNPGEVVGTSGKKVWSSKDIDSFIVYRLFWPSLFGNCTLFVKLKDSQGFHFPNVPEARMKKILKRQGIAYEFHTRRAHSIYDPDVPR